ncbi:LicD family protein [Adlercreutzia wanghongyangiae]|uniref:LicD family protein n=1 Tax=Adlercreutzia wanghongyangiae TaxID=3111451 RepID=UPI002DBDAAA3|nr:LicD family protein [Adlercreutzia sp. R21]
MRELSRREAQEVEIKLLEEFADICDQRGLRYYLAYGTLIGAARHEGFVPWDDDVDVMMPREDFERLRAEFDAWRLRPTSQFVHCRDGRSRFPFGRIIDTRTLVDENYCEGGEELGAWIDVFPLDDMPRYASGLFRRIAYWNAARMLAVSDAQKGASAVSRIAKRILVPLYRRKGSVHYAQKMDEAVLRWRDADSSCYAEILGVTERKKALPKEWFEPAMLPFELRDYCVPSNYDAVLTSCYGDWRELPPEDKRIPHPMKIYLKDDASLD